MPFGNSTRGLETGTQLVLDSSCVPVSAPSLASFLPWELNHAAILLTAARHDWSGLSICQRNAQVVNKGV